MPYSDYIIATPEPMLTLVLNSNPFTGGYGTMLTAYWKKSGFCWTTFIIGMLQNWLLGLSWGWLYSFWLTIPGFIMLICVWAWVYWHTYQVYKVSRQTYHC
jgi:hypothetical protein